MGLPSLSYPGNEGEPVRNFWYQEAPDPITPYHLGNLRQRLTDNLAFFVVLPRSPADVQAILTNQTNKKLTQKVCTNL